MILGAHLSIAGGLDRALDKAGDYGFDCVAIFVRNQVQWRRAPLRQEDVARFRRRRRELDIAPVVAHGSYLVNLAGRTAVRRKSITAMREDLRRCDRLGAEYLVFHPGSRRDAERGIGLIAAALDEIVAAGRPPGCNGPPPRILLETTAGQGNSLAHTFEQIASILALLKRPKRFGVCLDTCHVFAAGYDIRTPAACRKTLDAFDSIIGLDKLLVIHLNDSLGRLGSRIDRHAHIGRGKIGLKGFAAFVNDGRLSAVPMILETPKGKDQAGRDWDELNARTIRRLRRRASIRQGIPRNLTTKSFPLQDLFPCKHRR